MRPQQSKPRHGGVRAGAGRKSAYGEPTKLVRVPQSQLPVVADYLERLKHTPTGSPEALVVKVRPIAFTRSAVSVPAFGRRVRAGNPTSGDDYQEDAVDLGRHLVRDPKSTFVIEVDGWSMRDDGIADGDELVVDRSIAPEAGRIVIAAIDGELTVKRLRRVPAGWLLQAANPDYQDVVVSDKNELHIWGVVTRVVRKL